MPPRAARFFFAVGALLTHNLSCKITKTEFKPTLKHPTQEKKRTEQESESLHGEENVAVHHFVIIKVKAENCI